MPKNLFNKLKNSRGQVGIILILVAALGLLFYATSLNFGSVSQSKTIVTIASNTGASLLGSQMASYGQKLFKEDMGGKFKRCKTSWLSIFGFILAVVLLIVSIAFPPAGLEALALIGAITGVALSAAALVLQVTIIQPGLTSMWNKMMSKTLTMQNQVLQGGIQTALFRAATDSKMLNDFYDMDTDGVYGDAEEDKIGRFSFYYDQRVKGVAMTARDATFARNFRNSLLEFVYWDPFDYIGDTDLTTTPDNWALTDDTAWETDQCTPSADGTRAMLSVCNPCCIAPTIVNPEYDPNNPICKSPSIATCAESVEICEPTLNPQGTCPTSGSCSHPAVSPYVSNTSPPPQFKWVYNPHYQNPTNNDKPEDPNEPHEIVSFLEKMGTDDENAKYFKDLSKDPVPEAQLPKPNSLADFFTVDDATGVFPLYHYFGSWRMNLSQVGPLTAVSPSGEECYWHDKDYPLCNAAAQVYAPNDIKTQALDLPITPSLLPYENTLYVDGRNSATAPVGAPPVAIDRVIPPNEISPLIRIVTDDNQCSYIRPYTPSSAMTDYSSDYGFWKKGTDRFCSAGDAPAGTQWPYHSNCSKHLSGGSLCRESDGSGGFINVNCDCDDAGVDRTLWHDDAIDELVYGAQEFVDVIKQIFTTQTTPEFLAQSFEGWYDLLAPWIETKAMPNEYVSQQNCYDGKYANCAAKVADVGGGNRPWYLLQEATNRMHRLLLRLQAWQNLQFADDSVWCVPTRNTCSATGTGVASCPMNAPDEERRTFGNATSQGTLDNVIACLNYNIEGYNFHTAKQFDIGNNLGNDYRYQRCGETCSAIDCWNVLPRSLIPTSGFDRTAFRLKGYASAQAVTDDQKDGFKFYNCINNCSDRNCRPTNQPFGTLPTTKSTTGAPYYYPTSFDGKTDCTQTYSEDDDGNTILVSTLADSEWKSYMESNIMLASSTHDQNVGRFLKCLDNCNTTNCQVVSSVGPTGMPPTYTGMPATFPTTDPFNPIVFIYPPTPFNPATDCKSDGTMSRSSPWYGAITTNIVNLNPSCDLQAGNPWAKNTEGNLTVNSADFTANQLRTMSEAPPPPGGLTWLFKVRHSALEAMNQVPKFRQRRDFLVKVNDQLEHNIETLTEARDKFAAFLNSSAVRGVVTARQNLPPNEGLTNEVIYGWQSDPPESRKTLPTTDSRHDQGYWHIVKVEGGIPEDCLGSCNTPQNENPRELFPKLETYTKGFLGMTRCYEIKNRRGIVKMRVTRWDEDRDASALRLPNGLPIWDFKSGHQERKSINNPNILGACRAAQTPPDIAARFLNFYSGAFMISSPNDASSGGPNCWRVANGLLANGIMEETCAKYQDHKGKTEGFGFQFIKCPTDW